MLNVVTGQGESAGAALSGHPEVAIVSLTGEVTTGKAVMRAAADSLKRVHLELGGKAPVVVFDDADLEAAVAAVKLFGYFNAGQDCTASTRVIAGPGRLRRRGQRHRGGRLQPRNGQPGRRGHRARAADLGRPA